MQSLLAAALRFWPDQESEGFLPSSASGFSPKPKVLNWDLTPTPQVLVETERNGHLGDLFTCV